MGYDCKSDNYPQSSDEVEAIIDNRTAFNDEQHPYRKVGNKRP